LRRSRAPASNNCSGNARPRPFRRQNRGRHAHRKFAISELRKLPAPSTSSHRGSAVARESARHRRAFAFWGVALRQCASPSRPLSQSLAVVDPGKAWLNPKSQAPNPREIPIIKSQKLCAIHSDFGVWNLELVWGLELGIWGFHVFTRAFISLL